MGNRSSTQKVSGALPISPQVIHGQPRPQHGQEDCAATSLPPPAPAKPPPCSPELPTVSYPGAGRAGGQRGQRGQR